MKYALFVFSFLFAQIPVLQAQTSSDSLLTYSIEKEGPFVINGHDIWLERTIVEKAATEDEAYCKAVSQYRLLDAAGTEYYQKEIKVYLTWSAGTECNGIVRPFTISYSGGTLLALEYWEEPDGGFSGSFQFFGWHDNALQPFSNTIGGLSFGWIEDTNTGDIALLPGDRLEMTSWKYYYTLHYTLQLQQTENAYQFFPVPYAIDEKTGLKIFEVSEYVTDSRKYGNGEIFLYDSPDLKTGTTLTISDSTQIEFGKIYGEISPVKNLGYEISIHCLEVTVDGNQGFIQKDDYYDVGLMPAG